MKAPLGPCLWSVAVIFPTTPYVLHNVSPILKLVQMPLVRRRIIWQKGSWIEFMLINQNFLPISLAICNGGHSQLRINLFGYRDKADLLSLWKPYFTHKAPCYKLSDNAFQAFDRSVKLQMQSKYVQKHASLTYTYPRKSGEWTS